MHNNRLRLRVILIVGLGVTGIQAQTTVKDNDGNVYKTVSIGTQVWMAENLQVTTYNDGSTIPKVSRAIAWKKVTTGAYCNYKNDQSNVATYGRLYNWNAVNTGKVCPTGWHVPTNAEWEILENYLIANGYNYDSSTTDNLIAKAIASSYGWECDTFEGTIGNTDYPEKQNATGFTALPGGYRDFVGKFCNIGKSSYWWSSTEINTSYVICRGLYFYYFSLIESKFNKGSGLSVRCVRD